MARQDSIIKLNGTIDGISFYKSKDGHLARKAGGVSKARIASDPAFIRTRENGSEFGRGDPGSAEAAAGPGAPRGGRRTARSAGPGVQTG